MPSRHTNTTRPQKLRQLAEGVYCTGNQLIIDASKVEVQQQQPEAKAEGSPEEETHHPEEVGHAPHETSGKEGGSIAL